MSKHEKTLRRTRRKTDAARRKQARAHSALRHPRANPLGGSAIRHGAAVLAAAAAIAAGTSAYADQVRFDNPAHGEPGHFHWAVPIGDNTNYLDVIAPATEQPGVPYGVTGLQHINVGPDNHGTVSNFERTLDLQTEYVIMLTGVGSGDMIPSGVGWRHQAFTVYPGYPTYLPEDVPTYLGFRLELTQPDDNYGWIGVVRTGVELEAFAWGYETEPGVPVPAGAGGDTGCSADADCADEDMCTEDVCDTETGECSNEAIVCDDANVCNGTETCDSAVGCVEGTPLECDDGNACTADSCDPASGCINEDVEQTLIVKQGACPAPVNPNSNGVIPILLVGDVGFDVNNIDLASLDLHRCDGVGGSATPLAEHTKVKDLNHPGDGVACGECACTDDQSSDGIDDLSLKFRTDTTLAALGIGAGDGVVTVELTGAMMDGTPFCSRDCLVVVPPGSGPANATMESNVFDTFIEMTPLDLNVDSDGFADFTRAFVEGTAITLTAPTTSDGRRFLRWSVNGELQGFGIRTIEVTISADLTLKAFYQRPKRVRPNRPSEGSGDME